MPSCIRKCVPLDISGGVDISEALPLVPFFRTDESPVKVAKISTSFDFS